MSITIRHVFLTLVVAAFGGAAGVRAAEFKHDLYFCVNLGGQAPVMGRGAAVLSGIGSRLTAFFEATDRLRGENPAGYAALVEDLGDVDLLSLKDRPFAERLPLYRSAFEQVDKLFYAKPAKDFHLMPPFDAALYRWEQEYFFEYMVEDFLGLDAGGLRKNEAFIDLSQRLGTVARHLVHRDFQSQNLMIKDDKVWLIDFQGLRRGRQEYDLASLIFDPYLDHSAEEREQLLKLWEEIADERPLEKLFHECAAQRLMQALGAYGNIVKNRGDEWYRPHIATAARLLGEVTAGTPLETPLAPVLTAIRQSEK